MAVGDSVDSPEQGRGGADRLLLIVSVRDEWGRRRRGCAFRSGCCRERRNDAWWRACSHNKTSSCTQVNVLVILVAPLFPSSHTFPPSSLFPMNPPTQPLCCSSTTLLLSFAAGVFHGCRSYAAFTTLSAPTRTLFRTWTKTFRTTLSMK